ncbi:hypothetical protein JW979_03350, partial [bacterium]|nr:hypothetical protein [candidate division CSSED10-310 bacterium]
MPNNSNKVKFDLEKIQEFLLNGNTSEAEDALISAEKHTEEKSEKKSIDRLWVRLYLARGEVEQAQRKIKNYIKTCKLSRSNSAERDIFLLESLLNHTSGHSQSAEKTLDNLLSDSDLNDPNNGWILVNLGCILRDRGNWLKAGDCFQKAAQHDDKEPELTSRAALNYAEMLSDLGVSGFEHWAEKTVSMAPIWSGWEHLKRAQILLALHEFWSSDIRQKITELYRHLEEGDQLGSIHVRLRSRMALIKVLGEIGDWETVSGLILDAKKFLALACEASSRYYQSILELKWFEYNLKQSDIEN